MHHCCVFYHVDPDTSDKTAEQTTERKTGGQGAGTYIHSMLTITNPWTVNEKSDIFIFTDLLKSSLM